MNKVVLDDIIQICNENINWKALVGRRILITGARGYIATYLVYTLLMINDIYNLNVTVYAMCRDECKSREYYREEVKREDFCLITQDVCDAIGDNREFDIIIHAASIANIYAQHTYPYQTIEANVIGLNNVINYCEKHKCEKLLYFSSYMVYGVVDRVIRNESFTMGALDFGDYRNAYAFSKQMGELMLASKKREGFHTKTLIVRPMNIYGPGQRYSEKKPITDFLGNYLRDENIVLKSDGKQTRSYLYLTDAIKGLLYILIYGGDGESYNLASEKNVCQIRKLAEMVTGFNPELRVEFQKKDESHFKMDNDVMLADVSKLKSLGWKETIDLHNGLSRIINWAENESDFLNI